jgi:hypothetical protein
MKALLNQWFEQTAPFQGILACGVRHADRTSVSKTWTDGYAEMNVENAVRCAADLYQVMQVNKIPMGRARWIYQAAWFHCERRPDGTCLGVFTPSDPGIIDVNGLERFFLEFQAIAKTGNL